MSKLLLIFIALTLISRTYADGPTSGERASAHLVKESAQACFFHNRELVELAWWKADNSQHRTYLLSLIYLRYNIDATGIVSDRFLNFSQRLTEYEEKIRKSELKPATKMRHTTRLGLKQYIEENDVKNPDMGLWFSNLLPKVNAHIVPESALACFFLDKSINKLGWWKSTDSELRVYILSLVLLQYRATDLNEIRIKYLKFAQKFKEKERKLRVKEIDLAFLRMPKTAKEVLKHIKDNPHENPLHKRTLDRVKDYSISFIKVGKLGKIIYAQFPEKK